MTFKHILYDWNGLNVSLFQAINHASGEFLRPLAYAGNIAGNYWGMPLLLCVLSVSYTHLTLPTTPYV